MKTIAATIFTAKGSFIQPKRKSSPARTNPKMNIRPLSLTTTLCFFSFSFASRRLAKSEGALIIISTPAQNIGTKSMPIRIQPPRKLKVPAGKKISAPIITTPRINFIIASKNNLTVIRSSPIPLFSLYDMRDFHYCDTLHYGELVAFPPTCIL